MDFVLRVATRAHCLLVLVAGMVHRQLALHQAMRERIAVCPLYIEKHILRVPRFLACEIILHGGSLLNSRPLGILTL